MGLFAAPLIAKGFQSAFGGKGGEADSTFQEMMRDAFNSSQSGGESGSGSSPYSTTSKKWRKTQKGMSPLFAGGEPGVAGLPHLTQTLSDPYNVPDAALRQSLGGAETAYSVARQRMANNTLGSGAGEGGVARGYQGNIEQSRASNISDILRNWEQYKITLGDERLNKLLMSYLGLYNQDAARASAKRDPSQSSGTEDFIDSAIKIAGLF